MSEHQAQQISNRYVMALPASDTFLQFTMLMELIDEVASSRRTESITLRGPSGQTVGVVTVESGQIRFGVECSGQIYLDAAIALQAPELASLIRKYQARLPITEEDRGQVGETQVPRQLLCKMTAQALRQLAGKVQLAGARKPVTVIGPAPPKLLAAGFTASELILAAGTSGSLRQEDVAVQLFTTPPADTDERWLFEWPSDDLEGLWPIAVTRSAARSVADIAAMTALIQQLSAFLTERRRVGDRLAIRTQVTRFKDSICYCLATFRYLMVLFLRESQLSSILVSLQSFVRTGNVRTPEKIGVTHRLPAASPTAAGVTASAASPPPLAGALLPAGVVAPSKLAPRVPSRPLPPASSGAVRSSAAGSAVSKETGASLKSAAAVATPAPASKISPNRPLAVTSVRSPSPAPRSVEPKSSPPLPPAETRAASESAIDLVPLTANEWLEAASSLGRDAAAETAPAAGRLASAVSPSGTGASGSAPELDAPELAPAPRAVDVMVHVPTLATAQAPDAPAPTPQPDAAADAPLSPAEALLQSDVADAAYRLDAARAATSADVPLPAAAALVDPSSTDSRFEDAEAGAPSASLNTEPTESTDSTEPLLTGFLLPELPVMMPSADEPFPTSAVSPVASSEPAALAPSILADAASAAPASLPARLFPLGPDEAEPVLRLRDFSVEFGALSVCSGIDLELPACGLFVIGADDVIEKRLLVQALCGPRPSGLLLSGEATYDEHALAAGQAPASLAAGFQLMEHTVADCFFGEAALRTRIRNSEPLRAEFRALAEAAPPELRALLDTETIDLDPALLCVLLVDLEPGLRRYLGLLQATTTAPRALILDEPLRDLTELQRAPILGFLTRQAEARAVLIFTQEPETYSASARGTAWFCDGKLHAAPPPARGVAHFVADPEERVCR